MGRQGRPRGQLGQAQACRCQPLASAHGFDLVEHLGAQTDLQAHRTGQTHQQESDQQFRANFRHNLGDVLRWQQLQPTGERGHIDEHQRLIAQHQQQVGDGLGRSAQQRVQFGFSQVLKELFAVRLQVFDQGINLLHVIPQTVQRQFETTPVSLL
ncbi:hypothetical protein D3C84_527610 [compost metagenome]